MFCYVCSVFWGNVRPLLETGGTKSSGHTGLILCGMGMGWVADISALFKYYLFTFNVYGMITVILSFGDTYEWLMNDFIQTAQTTKWEARQKKQKQKQLDCLVWLCSKHQTATVTENGDWCVYFIYYYTFICQIWNMAGTIFDDIQLSMVMYNIWMNVLMVIEKQVAVCRYM